jgi:hypothetical protein
MKNRHAFANSCEGVTSGDGGFVAMQAENLGAKGSKKQSFDRDFQVF